MSGGLLVVFVLTCGAGMDATQQGAQLRWQPASGCTTLDDQRGNPGVPSECVVSGVLTGPVTVPLEVDISGWGDAVGEPAVGTFQWGIQGSIGYVSGGNGVFDGTYGTGDDLGPLGGLGNPSGGFINTGHPRWVMRTLSSPCLALPALNIISTINYEGGASILGGCSIPDPGTIEYAGTVVVTVPATAYGTYDIPFNPAGTKTFINDSGGVPIQPLTNTGVRITIPTGRCCYDLDTGAQCADRVTETECFQLNAEAGDYRFLAGQSCDVANPCTPCEEDIECDDSSECTTESCGQFGGIGFCIYTLLYDNTLYCCDPTNADLTELSDGDECTDDICDRDTGAVSHPLSPVGTECGGPPSGECDLQDTCNGVGACVDRLAAEGTFCGNPGGANCDAQDTCDAFGACVDRLSPAGTVCGPPVVDECDMPDACDDQGNCIELFAIEGTICEHDDRCVINEACDGEGRCLGELPWNGMSGEQYPCTSSDDCPAEWFCDAGEARVPGFCDCHLPCSSFTEWVDSYPPDCGIDARQPHAVGATLPALGWREVLVTFDCDPAVFGLDFTDFRVITDPEEPPASAPRVTSVLPDSVEGTLVLRLNRVITPGGWTCIVHDDSGSMWCMGYLPGDVGQDRTSNQADIQVLIDAINGDIVKPDYASDVNRSGLTNAQDILRLIDLFTVGGAFGDPPGPWSGKTIRRCPSLVR